MGDGGEQTVQKFYHQKIRNRENFQTVMKVEKLMNKAKKEWVFVPLGTFVTFGHKSTEEETRFLHTQEW